VEAPRFADLLPRGPNAEGENGLGLVRRQARTVLSVTTGFATIRETHYGPLRDEAGWPNFSASVGQRARAGPQGGEVDGNRDAGRQ
jgi:hypothetical protein